MPIPTLQGLQTALSGLMANQDALDVAGHNISNANTPGYSRQTAVLQTKDPMSIWALSPVDGKGAQLGTGVGVEGITRIRNSFLDTQFRNESSSLEGSATLAEALQQVQSALNEPSSSGMSSQLSAFWTSWSDLANSPTSSAAREAVVSAGTELASTLKTFNGEIEAVASEVSQRYATITGGGGEVASGAEQIAKLNSQIKLAVEAGQPPNDLLDRRDSLIDNLSKLAQVSVTENKDGTDTISFGGAAEPLVEGSSVHWPQELSTSSGGQLGALLSLTSPEGPLAGYKEALNQVAAQLSESVNALQPATPFFTGTTAASIAVTATPEQIQAGPEGEPGANSAALAVAALRGGEADQSYAGFVMKVGGDVQSATHAQENGTAMLNAIEERRQSVSGVSVDEEMTNLVTFQRGYEASARVMTAMDSMLETLIEHTGRVGL